MGKELSVVARIGTKTSDSGCHGLQREGLSAWSVYEAAGGKASLARVEGPPPWGHQPARGKGPTEMLPAHPLSNILIVYKDQ